MSMPVAHGTTSKGTYHSSAYFLKVEDGSGKEVLFWGDVESKIDLEGGEVRAAGGTRSRKRGGGEGVDLNREVWVEAGRRWDEGRLGGVFVSGREWLRDESSGANSFDLPPQIECSYTSDRPPELMFGHLHPTALYAELKVLASLVKPSSRPLHGLRVFVIHVKESLSPHPSRKTPKQRVREELASLEERAGREGRELGVEWVMAERGMRVLV